MKHDKLTHEKLVQTLEDRFDYLSARAVANEMLSETETPKGVYEGPQIKKFCAFLEKHYSRVQELIAQLKGSDDEVGAAAALAPAVLPEPSKKPV